MPLRCEIADEVEAGADALYRQFASAKTQMRTRTGRAVLAVATRSHRRLALAATTSSIHPFMRFEKYWRSHSPQLVESRISRELGPVARTGVRPETPCRPVFGDSRMVCLFPYTVTSSVDRGSVAYGEEGPQTGDPLQFVLATLAEVDSGAHDEVLDHSRYEDLTRCGECPDASRDMDR